MYLIIAWLYDNFNPFDSSSMKGTVPFGFYFKNDYFLVYFFETRVYVMRKGTFDIKSNDKTAREG